ncbi:GNAT family N-acetyltransferase [Actinoplanes sp. NPDC023714]|uniref:GNAT family N-acetyltransferase n=1 Tax=Actinoplanes sp. NPDC023714 TaxID=3154322 RepID=UPI0033C1D61E
MIIRPLAGPGELDLFNTLHYQLNDQIAADLEAGRRRPEWLWLALRDDRVVARAAWWSRPGDEQPLLMDVFDIADEEAGVELLRAALPAIAPDGATPPEYLRYLPPGWRDDPEIRGANDLRMAALERTGAKLFVERLRLEWRPGTPIPGPGTRLTFRPVADADELIGLMTQVLDGSLDAYSRAELTRMTAREAAEEQFKTELDRYASPHDWWRVAVARDGEPAGFVIPAHNGYNPIIAYLGVLPAFRGRGLIDDVLAEGTRVLAGEGVPRIRASTDVGNVPMAAAFARAGYVTFENQIDMTWG